MDVTRKDLENGLKCFESPERVSSVNLSLLLVDNFNRNDLSAGHLGGQTRIPAYWHSDNRYRILFHTDKSLLGSCNPGEVGSSRMSLRPTLNSVLALVWRVCRNNFQRTNQIVGR